MATIVNTPSGTTDSGSGMGMFMGMLAVLVLIVLFVLFGLPAIRGGGSSVNIQQPQSQPQLNVPDKINGSLDVNVNNPSGQ